MFINMDSDPDLDTSTYQTLHFPHIDSTDFIQNTSEITPLPNQDNDHELKWGVLSLSLLILLTILGNVLVCLAVCWESRLQNMTNYFLMSLAIADLLVAMLVMPVGMIIELYGRFPFSPSLCVIYIAADILMCTASIWHMCTMSMDRFFTLKYPMKYGRNKTKNMVLIKITFVWVVSLSICSPIAIMGFSNYDHVYMDQICAPRNPAFIIYGSVLAFYVPLIIMVVTYILTTRILHNNQKLMEEISKQHTQMQQVRKEQNGGITQSLYANMPFLSPNASYLRFYRPASYDASDIENITYDGLSDELRLEHYEFENGDYGGQCIQNGGGAVAGKGDNGLEFVAKELDSDEKEQLLEVSKTQNGDSRRSSLLSSLSASQPNLAAKAKMSPGDKLADELSRSQSFREPHVTSIARQSKLDNPQKGSSKNGGLGKTLTLPKQSPRRNFRSQPDLTETRHLSLRGSSSQHSLALPRRHGRHGQGRLTSPMSRDHAASNPHLANGYAISPASSQLALRYSSIKSITSVFELESVKNFDSISNASSVNSIMSREQTMSVWGDFERPVMLSKLTKIEAEMDLCLMENADSPVNNKQAKSVHPQSRHNKTQHRENENSRHSSTADSEPHSLLNTDNRNNSLTISRPKSHSMNSLASSLNQPGTIPQPQESSDTFRVIQGTRDEALPSGQNENQFRPHVIPPVCISSPSPINSRSSQASHSDLERDSSFKSQSSYGRDLERDSSFKSHSSCGGGGGGMDSSRQDHRADVDQVTDVVPVQGMDKRAETVLTTPEVHITTYKSNGTITENGYVDTDKLKPGGASSISSSDTADSSKALNGDQAEEGLTSDECLSETVSQMTQSTFTPFRQVTPRPHSNGMVPHRRRFTAPVWKTFKSKTRERLRGASSNGYAYAHAKTNIISKKTATNERKASKVLGIIFAVFVILWTPFFIVNILTSVCTSCNTWVPPELFTTLTWLGYVSSLMNPIIYTMFNTAFRKAFQKILTCQYPGCCRRRRPYAHAPKRAGTYATSYGRRLSATTLRRTNSALTTNNGYLEGKRK